MTSFADATAARHAYRRAVAPQPGSIDGDWEVEFLGNKPWLDALPRLQRILGINHLFGMRFEGVRAWHLVGKKPAKRLDAVKPLVVGAGTSVLDGDPTATLVSEPGNGKLWELFSSELRVVDADVLLGMDLVGWQQWQVPMPFVLRRHEAD